MIGILGLGLVVGCGGNPEAKAPSPAVDSSPLPAPEEAPDLSPVVRPAEVIVVGRVARPRAFVETLAKWSNLPVRLEDLLPEEARAVGGAVMWEAPVDTVVALDAFGDGKVPPPLVVASVGLKSLEAGLSAADAMQMPTRRLAPGVYRVGDFPDTMCAMAASLGTAPARLVCGQSMKDLDVLLPYVTRGLPGEPQTGADFELVATAKPIQERYGQDVNSLRLLAGVAMREAALDQPRFDRALSDAIYGSVDEAINLFGDLDQIRIEGRVDSARSTLLGSAELRLKGETSWTAGTIAAMKSQPVPATLPRIPDEATFACYGAPLPAERYAAVARILGELGEGYLEHEKLPDATRKRARRILDTWLAKLPESFAFVMSASQRDNIGYLHADTTVTRLSEPASRVLAVYGDMFGLLGDPGLKRWAKQKLHVDDKAWPKTTKKPLKLPGFKTTATAFEATFDLKALTAVDRKLADALQHAATSVDANQVGRLTIVVQPDGDFTYVIGGDDTREMARVMTEHKKSEPGARLPKPAQSDKVVLAGFFTLAFMARTVERLTKQPEVGKAVRAAPHRGLAAIPFAVTTAAGSLRFDFELPAATFSDASAAVIQASGALKGLGVEGTSTDPSERARVVK
jgi:hypothetical protein